MIVTNILPAALLFGLAFLAKFTTLIGFGAACISLFFTGRKKEAYTLFSLTIAVFILGIAAIYFASSGTAWDAFSSCATGGSVIFNPLRMFFRGITQDPVGLMIVGLAAAGLFCLKGREWLELPVIAFVLTAVGAALLFLSPGTDYNHLIDLEIISVLFALLIIGSRRVSVRYGVSLLFIVVIMASAHVIMVRPRRDQAREQAVAAVSGINRSGDKVLLIEDASLAILGGQNVYLLDAFALRLVRKKRADVERDFMDKLETGYFAAILLSHDIDNPEHNADEFYRTNHMGAGFVDKLRATYRRSRQYAESYIYVPKR